MQVQLVIFSEPKDGYAPGDWEDGGGGGAFGRGPGADPACARFAVADGATETYDSGRWASQLIDSFVSPGPDDGIGGSPDLELDAWGDWFKTMQDRWSTGLRHTSDVIEQMKIDQGTLATFAGGQLTGLDGTTPAWQAVAIGDSVLFHVRDDQLVTWFPRLSSRDFDSAPDGISTLPGQRSRMADRLKFCGGALAPGDIIYGATDALAKWIITGLERGDRTLWPMLGALPHPTVFTQLVDAERRTKALKDDDVTLMRIRLLPRRVSTLVVCL